MRLHDVLEDLDIALDEELLRCALTHSSYANENPTEGPSNQRLEFLGDAVLDLIVSETLYLRDPLADEGTLSSLRASLVCAETLARIAENLQLAEVLRLGHGELLGGGGEKSSILADAFEAVVAAIYLSGGIEDASRFVRKTVLSPLPLQRTRVLTAKSELEQWAQRDGGESPSYSVLERTGPDHAPRFAVEVTVSGQRLGTGCGSSKRRAEESAAEDALRSLGVR